MWLTWLLVTTQIALYLDTIAFSGKYLHFINNDPFQTFVCLQLGLIVGYLAWRLELLNKGLEKTLKPVENLSKSINDILSRTQNTRALSQEEFYSHFSAELSNATRAVDLTNLDPESPDQYGAKLSAAGRYYDTFLGTIRSRRHVEFRRVDRWSPRKKEWLGNLISDMRGQANFSLALLDWSLDVPRIPHVSVQIVDGERAYLVAISKHNDKYGKRDVQVLDKETASLWGVYYEDVLWKGAEVIVDRGRVVEEAWQKFIN